MTTKARKPKRCYTLADLREIAEQLNGRIKFDIVPVEMIRPSLLDPTTQPDKPSPVKRGAK